MFDSVKRFQDWDKIGKILFIISVLLLFGMVFLIFKKFFMSNDEYFTLGLIKLPVDYGIYVTAMDVHPPLYYLIVKFFVSFLPAGSSDYSMIIVSKLLSVIPYVVMLLVSACFFKRKYGWLTCGVLSFTLALMTGFFINYIIMRMYSWSVLFLFLSFVSMYLILTEKKNKYWVLFTLFSILGCYTHYFNVVSSVMLYLTLIGYMIYSRMDRSEIKKWFISAVVVILSYVPWMPSLLNQVTRVNNGYWIPPITFETVFNYLAYSFTISEEFMIQLLAISILIALSVVAFKYFSEKSDNDNFLLVSGILVFLLTLFAGVIVSLIKEPILYDRYLLASISLVMVVVSISLGKFRNNKVITILLALLLLFAVANVYEDYNTIDEFQDLTVKHEKFFDKANNDDSIFIFKDSISLLRFESFVSNADAYCIHNRYDDNLHKYIDFEDVNSSEVDRIINENPDKTIYYVTNEKLDGYENHKVVHLFSSMKVYSVSKP